MNTKDIVKKYGFKFSKSLGQNFLIDSSVVRDIVEGSNIDKDDTVIEIGPGVGTLTKELSLNCKKVYSIEIDSKLIPILKEEFKECNNVEVIHKDAMKVNFNEIVGENTNFKVVANLPYYITTPIISKLLLGKYNFNSLTIMIQKEVADRINAKPNCKEYGSISILVQYYCNAYTIRKVPPQSFIPQPKVESTIIKLDKLDTPRAYVKDEKFFFELIRSSFNMRRKTLKNALKNLKIPNDIIEFSFKESNIDPKRRGETLTIEEFAKLSNNILNLINN
ncbi:16S rRNA (adenine(1518)-N(6)/adenine(1519)-N(6))-dimethyltransferase RsmA [Clostridium acetireducens]|uniref:16S rRNA (adenine(1518)-N(6)/adenine(1519)-N(6))- dimethyltransferase RsmA n=1 Tax=Clostridium acetireducens TaxID=76489 RepID=UPI00241CE651|nr:16S rRNA (adenine(1518)-N(6)/adenine(1519)-N(6))-dimethyltransferase RsmA [Clostridium acetireducens]